MHLQTLCEELFLPVASADFLKRRLCLVDETSAESTETDLYKRTVEEDLSVYVKVADGLLQMRHEHHVTSLVVLIVQREEVDLAQHGAGSDDTLAVSEEVCAESLDERGGVVGDGAWGDLRVEVLWNGLPDVTLKDGDDLGRLRAHVSKTSKCKQNQAKYLEVNMLQSPHNDAVQRLLRKVKLGVLLEALDIDESADELSI